MLGFRRFRYHAWCLSSDELAAIGRGASMAPAFADHEHCKADVENHCLYDAFCETATLPPSIKRRAYLAVLEPGQALFVPALWHHAVASEPDPSSGVWKSTSASGARQFFTMSFLGDDAAVLALSSGEEPAPSRYRAGVASMAWRTTRRFSTNAP